MSATFTIECWGCRRSVSRPYTDYDDSQQKLEELKAEGWCRRAFGPKGAPQNWDEGPWFCSKECAYSSYNAVQAEEYWRDEDFKDYCQEANIPPALWGALFFIGLIMFCTMLGDCFHAGIQ